ncbi:branched-chain amino acid ABC transporter permease [Pontivivens nitratireducens]|uniref:branched-chain amino acid ABC transporter permease n=1 Tax=Pontivivens nitratireducens TaxID=2758038 RepID=UPI0016398E1E|nr:branched-chain amino acid ABC transporter permease [Pontibrevibacter nitratireducens]
MTNILLGYQPLFDLFLLHLGMAYSQWLVLRAGVFSLATAGLAAVGAYTGGILVVSLGFPAPVALLLAGLAGGIVALGLSIPLARLRGVYQAIATVAFIQIVLSLNIYASGLTGGPQGLNGIPKTVGTVTLLIAGILTVYLMYTITNSRLGRAFDAIRQNEAVAASLGVSIVRHQTLAFIISGALAGVYGALEAFHSYALAPSQFGFTFLISILAYVVLGGRNTIIGPIVGTAILLLLPEIARPLAEARMLVYGLLLILVINYLPHGIADTLIERARARRLSARLAKSDSVATTATRN